jgi:AAA15 family ATPase/GTPase
MRIAIPKGAVFVIDEIDISLHPLIINASLWLFLRGNTKGQNQESPAPMATQVCLLLKAIHAFMR